MGPHRQSLIRRAAACCLVAVVPCAAEFLSIEQKFGGIDCATCGAGVERALQRLRGVEAVELGEGVVRLKLASGNTIRLERVHDTLKGAGYTPGEARVEVRGKSLGGEFEVTGFDPAYRFVYEGKPIDGVARGVVTAPKPGTPLRLTTSE
ncbi:MAG TPA: hypothetical protein DEH78_16130 [Solibacterales bacterium]|nr:hypothetical protein [Bryobacterales bacterium]